MARFLESYDGTDVQQAVMVGDVFLNQATGRIVVVIDKRYNADLTVDYRLLSDHSETRRYYRRWMNEKTFIKKKQRYMRRVIKARRDVLMTEMTYKGVFPWSSMK